MYNVLSQGFSVVIAGSFQNFLLFARAEEQREELNDWVF